ncbi:cobaltochelatase subunit CobN [uncultured Methanolobus sp.]|uniref:cobaltochelatase subunit CobN n=1 Tax=uncultured Methanolobus sp. TaxID=218300 RepID=UPI002AAC0746|nr:cobaltochelatase subunit CobN [uncultured Methanolobus sp.]
MKIVDIGGGTGKDQALIEAVAKINNEGYEAELFPETTENLDYSEKAFVHTLEKVKQADFVILRFHGAIPNFKKFSRLKEVLEIINSPVFLLSEIPEEMQEFRYLFTLPDTKYEQVNRYVRLGGEENARGMVFWAIRNIAGKDVDVPEPVFPRTEGIYHPDYDISVSFEDYRKTLDSEKATVGILFWQGQWLMKDLEPIDLMIRELEKEGMNTMPVFFQTTPNRITGALGISKVIKQFFLESDVPLINLLIINTGFSQISLSSPGDGRNCDLPENFFDKLNVPVIQSMTTFHSYDDWKNDAQGLHFMELSSNVIWPEYDGQIITVPMATTATDASSGSWKKEPIAERVNKLARIARSYCLLKKTPASERKIAILLHQNPPRSDSVGGAYGLDAPESVVNMLHSLNQLGYHLERIPESGNELVREILEGVSNDCEWLSEREMMERAAGLVDNEMYRQWFEKIPQKSQQQMIRDWGVPPGEILEADNKIIVPGVRNGNIFIGLQPLRGFLEQAMGIYESTDLVMPHQYLAYYRWLKEEFGAQAIIHMGTHGTLEWLPGKGVGLSDECFPDIVLDDLPHFYPYIVDNPGEGAQAKRRSRATIIDHLIPSMMRADSYGELQEIEIKLQDYFSAKNARDETKTKQLLGDIYQDVKENNLLNDLKLLEDISAEELEKHLKQLYRYLCDVKDNLIKDGLHVFGKVPADNRFTELIYSLTRLKNGSVPSLREGVGEYMGFSDIRELQENASEMHLEHGSLKGVLLEELDSKAYEFICKLDEADYEYDVCCKIASQMFPESFPVAETMKYICQTLAPALKSTTDELKNITRGLDCGYVPPGPSGAPTRGNAHLLPTGKNFYSIDPALIPTPAAWEVGKTLADQMVEKYIEEEGCYPENVGVVVFATDTMKSGGDDIAYILWLMGLRPVWSARGGIVTGIEVIPANELGRPRMDVTLRISGLFRDAFPNLVHLIDDGVNMISVLDESEEENYLLKHLQRELLDSIKAGMNEEHAREKALVRIFGCPPGTYGAGVGELVEVSKWDSGEDLANMYLAWGGHAYGRKFNGEKLPELFRARLSQLDVTVKNHNSREIDILDNDDDYIYHGGMISCVKSFGNKDPFSLVGDSSDPESPGTRTLEEEGRFIFRSRVLNPKWLEGLKEHGYRGAQELSILVDYAFGWDATTGMMDDWMYQSLADKFIFDEETKQWIEENNPYALRQMSGRLLEAVQRGMWDTDDETVRKLTDIYMEGEDTLEETVKR